MAWTTPETYTAGLLMTATKMNLISANLNALKAPPGDQVSKTSNFDTTSTSFTDVTGLSVTITTTGGAVIMHFTGFVAQASGTPTSDLQFLVDATQSGILTRSAAGVVAMTWRVTGLSAGSHTIKVQMKVDTGTGRLAAATSGAFFYAGEVT